MYNIITINTIIICDGDVDDDGATALGEP